MAVDAIKEVIAQLPADERHCLAAWLNEFDYDEWTGRWWQTFRLAAGHYRNLFCS